ncbi:MAG: RnfH family protein [Acinetobacter sp.]
MQQVWVAYASAQQQFLIAVPYREGMTILDALAQSEIHQKISLPEPLNVGIFGIKIEDHSHVLQAGDRVEIYRALTINPKDIRRKRAEKNPVGRYLTGNRSKRSSS